MATSLEHELAALLEAANAPDIDALVNAIYDAPAEMKPPQLVRTLVRQWLDGTWAAVGERPGLRDQRRATVAGIVAAVDSLDDLPPDLVAEAVELGVLDQLAVAQ